jgi:branched-subunit amino acid aminotransferase/4-amino-4-deoxychorismate lyase
VTYSPTVILTGVKSLSYAANMQATRIAKARGAAEAILVRPDGVVLEAPTSSIFWVSAEGPLRTPALSTGILESITRARLVDELHVEEGEFELDDLLGAREAFLASTTREVQAIEAIDGIALVAPGPRTKTAAEAFARRVAAELTGAPAA